MNDEHRRRRAVAAQGFAALAFFVFAHGARAATTQPHAKPATPTHSALSVQLRRV
jgi:predicted lipoprotein